VPSTNASPSAAAFGFGTPFQAQIDYLRNKLNLPTEKWDDITRAAHDKAFIVAGAAKADLLDDLHQAVIRSASEGRGFQVFQRDFKALVAKHGWTGWTGEGSAAGEAWRARIIYQTNMSTSYWAGRYQQMTNPEVLKLHPYWRYIHSDTVLHPRPLHLAWHGLTLRWDHPFWQTHFAPNGYGCMCRITSVTQAEGEASARAGLGEPPEGWDQIDPKTGEQVGIDKSFGYAPGANVKASFQSLVDAKLVKLSPELAQAMLLEVDGVLANIVRVAETALPGVNGEVRTIASAVTDQPTWKTLGLPDLREFKVIAPAPPLLEGAASPAEALATLRNALGIEVDGSITVQTPVEKVTLGDSTLAHVVEKRPEYRERYSNYVLPTLKSPTEVWSTAYDDGSSRNRYIKLFSDSRNDLLVVVRVDPDGSIFWNMMQRTRKNMNDQRVGERIWAGE
jgi:hypothetical protein